MGKRKALKNQGSEFRKDMKNGGALVSYGRRIGLFP